MYAYALQIVLMLTLVHNIFACIALRPEAMNTRCNAKIEKSSSIHVTRSITKRNVTRLNHFRWTFSCNATQAK